MKCVYCNKEIIPMRLGGIISIHCCNKIQILEHTLRPKIRELYKDDPEIILRQIKVI